MGRKGKKGYVSHLKKFDIIFIVISVVICGGIFATGIALTHTKSNLATVIAICSLLPACKRLVNLIVIFDKKGITDEEYNKIEPVLNETEYILSDMLFSTEKYVVCYKKAVYTNGKFLAYSNMKKEVNVYTEDYFNTTFQKRAMNVHCKVFTNLKEYVNALSAHTDYHNDIEDQDFKDVCEFFDTILM